MSDERPMRVSGGMASGEDHDDRDAKFLRDWVSIRTRTTGECGHKAQSEQPDIMQPVHDPYAPKSKQPEAEAKPLAKPKNGEWTGQLQKGDDEGTVRGWLFCAETGGRIEFRGSRDPRPGHGYLLIGKVVPV